MGWPKKTSVCGFAFKTKRTPFMEKQRGFVGPPGAILMLPRCFDEENLSPRRKKRGLQSYI